jgi:DNA-directed RNA polymerase subunit N (RpoN/RPB10)
MPEPVRCDVCGKLYSSRHVSSHKRLAHGKENAGGRTASDRAVKAILEIYNTLSSENRKRVLAELASLASTE